MTSTPPATPPSGKPTPVAKAPPAPPPRAPLPWRVPTPKQGTQHTPSCNPNYRGPRPA